MPTNGLYLDVALSGTYAYVADFEVNGALDVIDVSDPAAPVLAGRYPTPHRAEGVDVSGTLAYVAAGMAGLLIVDVSSPSQPSLVGSYDTEGEARNVKVAGDYAYVANGEQGLYVLDVSVPTNPILVGQFDTPGYAYVVKLLGQKAYIADRWGGIVVVDVSTPSQPVFAGFAPSAHESYGVAVDGEYLYAADYSRLAVLCETKACSTPCLGPVCGNGVVEEGEECDDGNTVFGDGCDHSCQREVAICGNGILDPGEDCDDGNLVSGDGCDSRCDAETAVCGNGRLEPGEACDDGNLVAGDGCNTDCDLEHPGTAVTIRVSASTGNDTLYVGVPGSLLFSVEAAPAQPIAGLVFPLKYSFSNGNVIGPVGLDAGAAYCSFSEKAKSAFESLAWNPAHGQSATDPDSTLTGALDFNFAPWYGSGEVWRITFVPSDTGCIVIDSATLPPFNRLEALDPLAFSLPVVWSAHTICVVSGQPTGDVNDDELISSADIIMLVNYAFKGGVAPAPCEATGDVNCSGAVSASDILTLVNVIFRNQGRLCNAGGLILNGVWQCP